MNTKNTIEIEVNDELSTYIESLGYEVTARKNLLQDMITSGVILKDDAKKIFDEYHKEYVEFTAQFEMAKKKLEEEYLNGKKANWSLNYSTRILTAEILED